MDRLGDNLGLIRNTAKFDADRQVLLDALERAVDLGADLDDVGAGSHCGPEHDCFTTLVTGPGCRRIFEASSDLGNVAQPKRPLSGPHPQFPNIPHPSKPTLSPPR